MPDFADDVPPWAPEIYLQELKQRVDGCSEAIDLLQWKATTDQGKDWAPHLPQLVDALALFRDLCRDEIEHFGEWRYHGFQSDEMVDIIDEELDRVVEWICRMTGTRLPSDP